MKLLVLGAGGQVGRAFLALRDKTLSCAGVTRAGCDLHDEGAITRTIANSDADWVVNAAAYTAVDKAETDRDTAFRVNGLAPGWIARAARAAGKRTLHISTDFVFDGQASSPYPPDASPNPLGVYGASKREGELSASASDPDALIVRTSWVYDAEGGNFPRTMLRLMKERDSVNVVADQVGTPSFAGSLAQALVDLMSVGARGVHHMTDAGVASWYDLAQAVAEEAHAIGLLSRLPRVNPIRTADYPTPARRPAYSVLDKTASWAAIGRNTDHWRVNLRRMLQEIKH